MYAVSSTETVFAGFDFDSSTQRATSGGFQPPTSLGLLHELLHDVVVNRSLRQFKMASRIGWVSNSAAVCQCLSLELLHDLYSTAVPASGRRGCRPGLLSRSRSR